MNIDKELLPGEEVLYQSKSNPEKVKKNIGNYIVVIIILVLLMVPWFIYSNGIISSIVPAFLVIAIIPYILVGIKHIKAIKKHKNYYYFITNKRILIYNEKDGFMIYNTENINTIQCSFNGNYGFFKIYYELNFNHNEDNSIFVYIKKLYRSATRDDIMFYLVGIENPNDALKILKNMNPNISIQ